MAKRSRVISPDDPAYAGQAFYKPLNLRGYDFGVLRVNNRFFWRCPTHVLISLYEANVGASHLDAGPGSGYYLDTADLPHLRSLTLVDANPNVLDHAGRRLERFAPTLVEANLLEPLTVESQPDSVGLNYVLHCLPGPMTRKEAAVEHLTAVLRPEGRLFGSTILGTPALHNRVGLRVLRKADSHGFFGNVDDSLEDLQAMLSRHLAEVTIDVHGAVAVFAGTKPE